MYHQVVSYALLLMNLINIYFSMLVCCCYLKSLLWQVLGVVSSIFDLGYRYVPAAPRPPCSQGIGDSEASQSSCQLQPMARTECPHLQRHIIESRGVLQDRGSQYERQKDCCLPRHSLRQKDCCLPRHSLLCLNCIFGSSLFLVNDIISFSYCSLCNKLLRQPKLRKMI